MKVEKNILNKNDIQSTSNSKEMKLAKNSDAIIFQMFTGGLYSDPVGSLIREITSNAFDAHVEAGKDTPDNPVIVAIKKEVSGHFFTVTDNGVGMSPERVEMVFGTYFESTKDGNNDQIGGFGIGGKTPLAYTNSFYIVTRHNGIEYTYNIFEGNNKPEFELMNQTSTTKGNGTEVKVPIKQYDINEFERKTLKQLYYFENIVFEGFSDYHVSNDYKIIKGKNFLYRGNNYERSMHLCLGKVAYPINFDTLELDQYDYNIPVAVKLNVGELDSNGVIPSREQIKYTKKNIAIIKQKIKAVMDELKELLGKQYNDVKTLEDYYRATENFGQLYFDEDTSINLKGMYKPSDVSYTNFKYADLKLPQQDELLEKFYNIKLYGKPYAKRGSDSPWNGTVRALDRYSNVYYTDGEFKRVVLKQGYLKSISSSDNFYVCQPFNLDTMMDSHLKAFGVLQEVMDKTVIIDGKDTPTFKSLIPKKKGEKLIKQLAKDVRTMFTSKVKSYDDIEVPEDFKIARKKNTISPDMLKTTIPFTAISDGNRRFRATLKNIQRIKGRIYYGFGDDSYALDEAYGLFHRLGGKTASGHYVANPKYADVTNFHGNLFIKISRGNEKYMKMLGKKAIHVSYFYQTFVARKIDMIMTSNAISNDDRFGNINQKFSHEVMKWVDLDVYNTTMEVKKYKNEYSGRYYLSSHTVKAKLGIDLDSGKLPKEIESKLSMLTDLTAKNNKLKWFEFPYYFDAKKEDHQELISMVSLMFDR